MSTEKYISWEKFCYENENAYNRLWVHEMLMVNNLKIQERILARIGENGGMTKPILVDLLT